MTDREAELFNTISFIGCKELMLALIQLLS